jgi:GNAT superfamily N-acetyltransferase
MASALVVRPVGPGDFPLVERLFGPQGACAGCWCMDWRRGRGDVAWHAARGEANRRALVALIGSGASRALLALADGEPVGWCDLGPCASYPRLATRRGLAVPRPEGAWAVVCFYVLARCRRRGVAQALLAGAVAHAAAHGATVLEAYPAETRGRRLPEGVAYTGVPAMYERAGFQRLPRPEGERPIYRLSLPPSAAGSASVTP